MERELFVLNYLNCKSKEVENYKLRRETLLHCVVDLKGAVCQEQSI